MVLTEQTRAVVAIVAVALVLIGAAWMVAHPAALRDESSAAPRPFSYSRVQLWWWTIVVMPVWLWIWGRTGSFWQFNETCLALLGIGSATTVGARIIDARDSRDSQVVRHQNAASSKGFFEDILSDEQGVSIHRFQSLIINVAYAFAFITQTFEPERKEFPTFDGTTLALLGISSATYVAVKASENRESAPRVAPVSPAAGQSDELLDPGGYDDVADER